MGKTTFVLGAAVGYVLGARAGRSSYDQIVAQASRLWGNPKVQETVQQTVSTAKDTAANSSAVQAVKDKLPSSAGGTSSSDGSTSTSSTGAGGTGTPSAPITSPVVDPLLNTPSTTGQPGTKTPSTPATPGTAFPHGV